MPSRHLPLVQSLPHPGLQVPPEVADRLAIDDVTIFNECDLWADQLFDFAHPDLAKQRQQAGLDEQPALAVVKCPIARVLIDANRPGEALANPDGPVKTQTSYGDPIYRTPLTDQQKEELRAAYWQPFHQRLDAALRAHAPALRLLLDCHNMAQEGPAAYRDAGEIRPLLCIANFGDAQGERLADGPPVTAPPGFVRRAAEVAQEIFGDLALLVPTPGETAPVVAINQPFVGGHILRHYCDPAYQRQIQAAGYAGLMVEVNRGLFVGNQSTRSPIQPPNAARISLLRQRLFRWTQALLALLPEEPA